jgi:hypothetical protein
MLAIPRQVARPVMTVRGLSTLNDEGHYWGVVLAEKPNLSRAEAQPIMTAAELRAFVVSQWIPKRVEWEELGWEGLLHFAQFLLSLGIRPEDIPCFILDGHQVSMREVREWLVRIAPGRSVRIMLDEDVYLPDPFNDGGRISVDLDSSLERWEQPGDLVVAVAKFTPPWLGRWSPSQVLPGLPPVPEEKIAFQSFNEGSVPWSLPAFVLEAAAKAWGVDDVDSLLRNSRRTSERVGELDGVAISQSVLRVSRPAARPRKSLRGPSSSRPRQSKRRH